MREQLWVVPSGDDTNALRATVFRPDDADAQTDSKSQPAPRPLVIINHGTDERTRESVSMPVYFWLSRWFVDRGYVVVLPQRRGHGATGGIFAESIGTCARPDHFASGLAAADDIAAVVKFMAGQPFIDRSHIIVAGASSGGWASLALSTRNPPGVSAIVNFAGGRGGHAYGRRNEVCGADNLIAAAQRYGAQSRIPTIWFYSKNDSYFEPALAGELSHVWQQAGGLIEYHMLPAYGADGHTIADDRSGWDLWGDSLDAFLVRNAVPPASGLAVAATAPEATAAGDDDATTTQASADHRAR